MSANNKPLVESADQKPAPQYFSSKNDAYEYAEGENGAPFSQLVNTQGVAINPANLETLQQLLTILQAVYDSTNGQIKTSGNSGSSGTVDISDRAARLIGKVTLADGGSATLGSISDATISAGATGTINAKLSRLSSDLSTLNTNINSLITNSNTLNSKDFATQTTLATAKSDLDTLVSDLSTAKTDLDSLAGKDFATQTTLSAINTTTTSLNTNIGSKTDTAVTDYTASASEIAALKGLLKLLAGNGIVSQKGVPYKTQDSTANTTNTITLSAVASQKYRIYGYYVLVTGASNTSAINITLTDNSTIAWKDGIPIGTTINNGVGVMFPQPLIASAVNTSFTISATAGGTSVITTINLLYDTM